MTSPRLSELSPDLSVMVQQIANLGYLRMPAEAVGLWVAETMIELPNRSKTPQSNFEFFDTDVGVAMASNNIPVAIWNDAQQITLWHTHPAGGVGPSRLDMRSRLNGVKHLVVALTDEGPVPTWY